MPAGSSWAPSAPSSAPTAGCGASTCRGRMARRWRRSAATTRSCATGFCPTRTRSPGRRTRSASRSCARSSSTIPTTLASGSSVTSSSGATICSSRPSRARAPRRGPSTCLRAAGTTSGAARATRDRAGSRSRRLSSGCPCWCAPGPSCPSAPWSCTPASGRSTRSHC